MSKQPRKQRKERAEAPLHERHDQVRAPLSADLRDEYGTRSVRVNAGDTVEVTRGDFAGETGEVTEVDLRGAVVHVEEVVLESADGEEVPRPLDASNLRVTNLDLDDPVREQRLESSGDPGDAGDGDDGGNA
ncbi:50S ribosomal protein L24 [Halobacteriales archaeon QS_8_65_32]|jgi:large subunit ribosomal protein L24|nr:MAG: 50S ribosomal protein L24 [Halobacteriales archaeon QS_8_65_32]